MKNLYALFLSFFLISTLIKSQSCDIRLGEDYDVSIRDYERYYDPGAGGIKEWHGNATNFSAEYLLRKSKIKKVQFRYKYDDETEFTVLDPVPVDIGAIQRDEVLSMELPKKVAPFRIEYQTRAMCVDAWTSWVGSTIKSYDCDDNLEFSPVERTTSTSRTIEVEFNDGAKEYELKIIDPPGNNQVLKVNGANTPVIKIENLQNNTEYLFSYRTTCIDNERLPWTEFAASTKDCSKPILSEIHISNQLPSITVWLDQSGSHYQFRIKEQGASSWNTSPILYFINSYIFNNIERNQNYEIQARISCNNNIAFPEWKEWSNSKIHYIPVSCPQPNGDIGAKNIGTKTATLFCRSGHGEEVVERHQFRYRIKTESIWINKNSANNEIDIKNLTDNTDYEMQVQHNCLGDVTGSWSSMKFFTTEQKCKIESDKINIRNIGYDQVEFKSKVERAGYIWKYRKAGGGGLVELPQTNNPVTITGLSEGTTYEVALKAFCDPAYSDGFTDWVIFTTLTCEQPVHFYTEVLDIHNHGATFYYPNHMNAIGFEWQYRKQTSATWKKVESNSEYTTLDGLVPNTSYVYRVRAECQPGAFSEWSFPEIAFQTNCEAEVRRFSNTTSTSMIVYANESSAADLYTFRYRVASTANWIYLPSVTIPQITVNNLSPNTQYEFQVQGGCFAIEVYWSASLFNTTRASLIPEASPARSKEVACDKIDKSELSVTNITEQSVELGCSRAHSGGFIFRYASSNSTNWKQSSKLVDGTWLLNSLLPATNYKFQGRIVCASDSSDWSDSISFTTKGTAVNQLSPCFTPTIKQIYPVEVSHNSAILYSTATVEKYQFRYKKLVDNAWIELPEQKTNRILLNKLSSNQYYVFQCKAFCNDAFGKYSIGKVFKTEDSLGCSSPGFLETSILLIQSTQAPLLSQRQAKFYQYRYRSVEDSTWTYTDTIAKPLFTLDELLPGKKYFLQARLLCDNLNISPFSPTRVFTTLPDCKSILPTKLKVDSINTSGTILKALDITSNGVLFRYRPTGTQQWNYNSLIPAAFVKTSNLLANTQYEFQALSVCTSRAYSRWSASAFFTTSLSTATKQDLKQSIMIYPNPTDDYITIQSTNSANKVGFSIFDLSGKIISQGFSYNLGKINLTELTPGIYLLNLRQQDKYAHYKIIKQ